MERIPVELWAVAGLVGALLYMNARSDRLGRFFTLAEFERSSTASARGINNEAPPAEVARMRDLVAKILDPLRESVGVPVRLSSGYRSPALNAAIGGAASSQHTRGEAADVEVTGWTAIELRDRVVLLDLPYDQMITYDSKPHLHLSHGPRARRQELRHISGQYIPWGSA